MALIQCPECGQQISDKAKVCIHCGFELPKMETNKELEKTEAVKTSFQKSSNQNEAFVSLMKKWVTQDTIITLISGILKTALIILMVSLILIRFFMSLQASLEQNSSIREFFLEVVFSKTEISYYALMFQIWGFVEFLRICTIKIVTICTEKMRMAAIQEFGTKKYLYFCVNSFSGDAESLTKYSMLAMPLQVAEERKKRTISTVIYFIQAVVVFIYFMSFTGVAAVQIYEQNYSNVFEFFFKNMLGFIISGIVLLTVHIILIFKDNTETRCGEWLASLVLENPETEQEELPAETLAQAETQKTVPAGKKQKNKVTALLLCIFLGQFGVHRFYEGKIGTGLLYLFTFGLCGVGEIVDLIRLIRTPNPYYV